MGANSKIGAYSIKIGVIFQKIKRLALAGLFIFLYGSGDLNPKRAKKC